MARPVIIPLAAGLQTELAEALVQPGATLVMENCASEKTGKSHVRLGADVLSTATQATIPASGTLPVPWQLATLEGMLVRFNRAPVPIHTWARPANAWVETTVASGLSNSGGLESFRRGPIKLDTAPVFSGTAQVSDATIAVGTNIIVCVHQIGPGGGSSIQVELLDRLNRRPLFTNRIGSNARGARVMILGTKAVVAYEQTGNLHVDSYNLTTCSLSQQVTLGALTAGTPIDMRVGSPVVGANNIAILYRDNAGVLKCATVDATNLATNSTFGPRTTAAANVSPDLAFGWMQDFGASGKFSIMIADTTNGLRTLWDLPAPGGGFSNATATHVLDAGATAAPTGFTPGIRNIIGTTIDSTATGKYRVLYEMTATSVTTTAQIKIAVWNGAATLGVQYRSVGIRSKFWQHSTNFYCLVAFDGNDQRSYFVLAMSNDTTVTATTFCAPLAVALPRDAAGFTENISSPSDVASDSDGSIFMGVTEQTRIDPIVVAGAATGIEQRLFGVDVVRVRHPSIAETEIGKPVEFIRSLFVPGGLLGQFDGASYDSACFPYYPPNTLAGAAAIAGGSLGATANYFWRFVYSKMDRNGRVWRSSPSAVLSSATTGVNKQFTMTIDTLRLVDRGPASGTQGFRIEAYRSQANAPDAFFLAAVVDNDPTNDTVTFTDNVADASLGEELYTDGGGVENQLLPSVSCVVEYQGRLVIAQAGTGTIWYSMDADFDHGLIFNEALTQDVGDPSDPITGLAVYMENLVVFKAGKIYVLAGEGANALGQGGGYTARLVEPAIGCSNAQSICIADDGVWFRSGAGRAGIHRTAGGAAEYVGGGVHDFDNLTITSAVVVRDRTEIRFYTLEGYTLVWNWTIQAWGTNTDQPCLSAIVGYSGVAGVVYARLTDNFILSEATTASLQPYIEGGIVYSARIRTPWYRLAGALAGWGRIRRIQGVGELPELHRTVVGIFKNFELTPFSTHTIVFDTTRARWDWEARPAQQPMSTVMIEIIIAPYQPPNRIITPGATDSYDGVDPDGFGGDWTFDNGAFTSADLGAAITITGAGGGKDGTYTIGLIISGTKVGMSPVPGGGTGHFAAATITLTPALVYTAGPNMVGVALLPVAKEGMDKLPASRRVT